MWTILIATAFAQSVPSVDTPLKTGAKAPGDAAVVIGVEDYAFVADVPYAARDAQAMYDFLVYTRGVPPSSVRLLKGGSREQIVAALEGASELVSEKGTLWVYFAGHGAASASTGERMLLGDDVKADPAAFEARAVPLSLVHASTKGKTLNLMVDACYSGVGRGGAEIAPGKRFAVPSYAMPAAEGGFSWTAASGDELSGPLEPAQHGAFTYFALGALRGWADGQIDGKRDGLVTTAEASLYVQEALREVQITTQTPEMVSGTGEELVIMSSAPERAPKLTGFMAAPEPVAAPVAAPPAAGVPAEVPAVAAPVAQAGALSATDNMAVQAELERIVRECMVMHGGSDAFTWSINFSVQPGAEVKGMFLLPNNNSVLPANAPTIQRSGCIANGIRGLPWADVPGKTKVRRTINEKSLR